MVARKNSSSGPVGRLRIHAITGSSNARMITARMALEMGLAPERGFSNGGSGSSTEW